MMGLVSKLLTLPVSAPLKGSLWIGQKIHEAADQELHDPAALRSALSHLEKQLLAGEISEEEYDEAELVLLARLQAAAG